MAKKDLTVAIPDEVIASKIFVIRGEKVIVDADLAELYGVETKRLKEQVRRNITRFPSNTKVIYILVQRCAGSFYQDDFKNRCIAWSMDLFLKEVLMKNNKQIGLKYNSL